MNITADELKKDLDRYLSLAEHEDIIITQNDRIILRITSENCKRLNVAKSLFGIIPADITLEEAREEHLTLNS